MDLPHRRLTAASAFSAALLLAACGAGTPVDPQAAALRAGAASGHAAGGGPGADDRAGGGRYVQRNLVSDGAVPAERTDPNLVNAWGLARLPTSPWWVADNGAGVSTLYDGEGVPQFGVPPLVVAVTGDGGAAAAPTGAAANPTGAFVVSAGGASGPARFLFASEDGTLSGWNPGVPPPPAGQRSTQTIVAVDNAPGGAVYKGLALAVTAAGPRLYATDFHGGRVDVFDGAFAPVTAPGAFVDPSLPPGFAPFGIMAQGDVVYVTYALQDAQGEDEVDGQHLGYVDAFGTDGTFLRRVASRGKLDAPWGMAVAPASGFGRLSGRLLVGNFGDGHVVAFRLDGAPGEDDGDGEGAYLTARGGRVTIEGLWGLAFGNDSAAGPSTALFFAAGPGDEAHGLFGRIDFVPGGGED